MDPNVNIHEQLQLAKKLIRDRDAGRAIDPHAAIELAERVLYLDDWLKRLGALPDRWHR